MVNTKVWLGNSYAEELKLLSVRASIPAGASIMLTSGEMCVVLENHPKDSIIVGGFPKMCNGTCVGMYIVEVPYLQIVVESLGKAADHKTLVNSVDSAALLDLLKTGQWVEAAEILIALSQQRQYTKRQIKSWAETIFENLKSIDRKDAAFMAVFNKCEKLAKDSQDESKMQ